MTKGRLDGRTEGLEVASEKDRHRDMASREICQVLVKATDSYKRQLGSKVWMYIKTDTAEITCLKNPYFVE